jgi:hypothetical protein
MYDDVICLFVTAAVVLYRIPQSNSSTQLHVLEEYWMKSGLTHLGDDITLGPIQTIDSIRNTMTFFASEIAMSILVSHDPDTCSIHTLIRPVTLLQQELDSLSVQGHWVATTCQPSYRLAVVAFERMSCFHPSIINRLGLGLKVPDEAVHALIFDKPFLAARDLELGHICFDEWTGIISILWWSLVQVDPEGYQVSVQCHTSNIRLDQLARQAHQESKHRSSA